MVLVVLENNANGGGIILSYWDVIDIHGQKSERPCCVGGKMWLLSPLLFRQTPIVGVSELMYT